VLDDGEPHAPLVVLSQLRHGRQQVLAQHLRGRACCVCCRSAVVVP
jgi:hypothetical protein